MPPTRSKNKKQIPKRTMKESVKQPIRVMKTRLMEISLKADDYIYKQKPISIQQADTYAREMEAFRIQCQDERYLQVIEKLTGYMNCIIREQAPKDIIDAKIINPIGNPIEDAATPESSAIIDLEMERSFSNLSIGTDPKDSLADMDNIDIHQEKAKIEHSNSAVTEGIFKKVVNYTVAHKNKEPDTSNLPPKPVVKKQKEIVNDSNVESQNNILSNFKFENHTSLSSLRNYRNSTNKHIQQSVEYAAIKIADSENTNTGNYTNKPEISNMNYIEEKEIVDDSSNLSPNLLNDFYYINNSDAVVSQNNTNPKDYQSPHGNEISGNIANTIKMGTNCSNKDIGNGRTKLEEVMNLKTIKQKELGSNSTKLSQNIMSNYENGNYAVSRFLHNNLKSNQLLHVNERPNNVSDARYKATNSINMNIGKCDTKSKMSKLNNIQQKENELDGSQNTLGNFENEKYAAVGIVQNNTSSKHYQTKQMNDTRRTSNDDTHSKSNLVQHKTFKPSTFYDIIQDNTIFKSNTQNNFMPLKMMQLDITNNPSQKPTNKIETRKNRKKSTKNVIANKEKKRPYNRKNKVNGVTTARNDLGKKKVDSANRDTRHPENSDNKSKQKSKFFRKKIQKIDITWVENMKFVRAIETDEYIKFDSLEESFWTDLSLPSNMSTSDFEYDQINIWKN